MINITHFQTFLKIPKRVKSSNLGTKSLKVRVLAKIPAFNSKQQHAAKRLL